MAPRQRRAAAKPPSPEPDNNFFFVVLGLVLAVLIPILQSNGVEVNWQTSIFAYLVLMGIIVWSFLTHATPHRSPTIRLGGTLVIVLFVGLISVYATIKQYGREHSSGGGKEEQKIVQWLLPEIDLFHPYIVFCGGHFQRNGEFGYPMIYGGSRAVVDTVQMGCKDGAQVMVSNGQYTTWPAMVARTIGGKACIDVHISGSKAPIEIENGESTQLPEHWDWNSDATAMEIVDDQYRVVFQEEFIPTNQVIVRGDIQYQNTMIEAGTIGWPTTKPHIMVGDTGLTPLFLYPSERHPSKRNPNYGP